MGPPPSEAARNKQGGDRSSGREDAIETLIDMDPCGASYRVARTMNGALASALHGRSNRIPDASLFDAAHALSRFEITADDLPDVGDLYSNNYVEGGSNRIALADDGGETADWENKEDANEKKSKSKEGGGEDSIVTAGEEDENAGSNDYDEPAKEFKLKGGWKDRILRHHDKMIRAKNHAAKMGYSTTLSPQASTRSVVTSAPVGGGAAGVVGGGGGERKRPSLIGPPAPNTTDSATPVPPPSLISALRQIFGTASSSDLQDLLLDKGEAIGGGGDKSSMTSDVTNTLPSLLHAVINHAIFTGTTSSSSSDASNKQSKPANADSELSVKRDWKSMFDDESKGEREGHDSCATSQGGEDDDDDDDDLEDLTMSSPVGSGDAGGLKSPHEEVEVGMRTPPAANLESILGNACRDVLRQSSSQNSQLHGLLIAALSVMTGCLLNEDELDRLNNLATDESGKMSTAPGSTTTTVDCTNDDTDPFTNSLQVAGLLSVLPRTDDKSEELNDDDIMERTAEFTLDEKLLQYFVNASSTYEERIEIQKANLLKSRTATTSPTAIATPKKNDATGPNKKGSNDDAKPGGGSSPGSESSPSVIPLDSPSSPPQRPLPPAVGGSDSSSPSVIPLDSHSGSVPDLAVAASASADGSMPDLVNRENTSSSGESSELPGLGSSGSDEQPAGGGVDGVRADFGDMRMRMRMMGGIGGAGIGIDDDARREAAASILLGDIVNLVANASGGRAIEAVNGSSEEESSDDDDIEDISGEPPNHYAALLPQSSDDSHSDNGSNDEENSASASENEDGEEAEESEVEDNEEEEGDDDSELQRALALSLAAAIGDEEEEEGSGSSNGNSSSNLSDNDDDGDDDGSNAFSEDTMEFPASTTAETATTPQPHPSNIEKKSGGEISAKKQQKDDDSMPLPPLPTFPPLSFLPKHQHSGQFTPHAAIAALSVEDEDEIAAVIESMAASSSTYDTEQLTIFEPSALSTFGKLPASHVLMHLLRAVLVGLMHGGYGKHDSTEEQPSSDANGGSGSGNEADTKPDTKPSKYKANAKPSSRFFAASSKKKMKEEEAPREDKGDASEGGGSGASTTLEPDSTTLSLLIASLNISSHLRNSAVGVLEDLLSDFKNMDTDCKEAAEASIDEGATVDNNDNDSDSSQGSSIQIANTLPIVDSSEYGPILPPEEKEDPASAGVAFGIAIDDEDNAAAVSATISEDLEKKGLKRKAAAAAQIAMLRRQTQLRLLEVWKERVAYYSTCCLLNLRCLRVLMGKNLRRSIVDFALATVSSGSTDEQQSGGRQEEQQRAVADVLSISAKTRLGLLSILSSFASTSAATSLETLRSSLSSVFNDDKRYAAAKTSLSGVDELHNQFHVIPLRDESVYLWGMATPLLYSDQKARVDLLGGMLSELLMSPSIMTTETTMADSHDLKATCSAGGVELNSCTWTDADLQRLKIDVYCKRLRVSDMLNCFVASPMASTDVVAISDADRTVTVVGDNPSPDNSLAIISLLSAAMEKQSSVEGGGKKLNSDCSNLAKFYLALCQRSITSLILWNNLSLSSSDVNDHDISGGSEMNTGPNLGGVSGGTWGDGGPMSLKLLPQTFHFDSAKCADSISVASASQHPLPVTANQRATKVWGTVLSTSHFNPKTGIHRWAIKLDRCERGHVFVGVATSRANLKTYVGGDSNGWGLIGTQALWHDRNKIRGDYGSTFRTGAVVVVTLDTNVGTLSFGLWKDNTGGTSSATPSSGGPLSSPSASLLTSPRRGSSTPGGIAGGNGPVIEDWGIAFEGLPLDVKLYPAVGLYQRDDRVTLYTISNSRRKSSLPSISSGDIYFPSSAEEDYINDDEQVNCDHLSLVRSWNRSLCSDGISFVTEVLSRSIQLLSSATTPPTGDDVLLTEILPALASSICLIPSCIPTISAKYAMELLPFVTRCAKLIDKMILPEDSNSLSVELKEGTWVICVDPSSEGDSKDDERYSVILERKEVEGINTGLTCYQGESKNNCSVIGATFGTRVQLVEEWCNKEGDVSLFEECAKQSTSSRVIDARVSLDGKTFEGVRHNVQKNIVERITGHLQQPCKVAWGQEEAQTIMKPWSQKMETALIQTESLLCLAVGHLSLILCSQTSLSDIDKDSTVPEATEKYELLLSKSSILSSGLLDRDGSRVRGAIDSVWERCRSADMYTDVVEKWQDSIYFDLFLATDESLKEDETNQEEARSVIQQTGAMEGSLSRLCPAKYATAQKMIASAIFYHIIGLRSEEDHHVQQSEVASQALRASIQVLENGIREALVCAEANVPRKEVCERRCLLSEQIAEFLLEFPCTPDDNQSSVQSIVDDVCNIFKAIKVEQDIECMKQLMNTKTEKCIMRYVGLRSLHLLFQSEDSLVEGIRVHSAIESALVSLPRLLSPSSISASSPSELDVNKSFVPHLATNISGCAASVQTCVHSCVRSLYEKIGSFLATTIDQESGTSLRLGLLSNYFTVFHSTEYEEAFLKLLPSLRSIIARSRNQALLLNNDADESTPQKVLLNIIYKQENQRLLRTSASVLLTTCAQLSRESGSSPHLIELLTNHLIQEISETVSFVAENTRSIKDGEDSDAVQSDWGTIHKGSASGSKPQTSDDADNLSSKGLAYLSDHGTLSMKQTSSVLDSPSTIYFGQLLHVLHVALNSQAFIESTKKRATTLFSAFGLQLTEEDQSLPLLNGLPLKFCRRILRLLRPILLSMEANTLVIHQLFEISGSIAEATQHDAEEIHTIDDLLLVHGAISLLRYLYTFSKSWKEAIDQSVVDDATGTLSSSPSIFCGMLAFFGGAPSSLQPGAFVVIEPEVASSSSSAGIKSLRSLAGAPSSATNTSSSGTDEIVTGLCRHNALSGVLSSVDPRTGRCEVIVLGNKSHVQLPPSMSCNSGICPSRVTIRAVRASSANVSAADELPLVLDGANLPAGDIFDSLLDLTKSVSSSIKASTQDKELTSLQTDAFELMKCAMGLRSTTVLVSEPKLLHKYVADECSSLRLVLAHALLMASLRNNSSHELSSLPSLEARVWHLLSVHLEVKSRANKLDSTSTSSLKELFKDEKSSKTEVLSEVSPSSDSGRKGYRTPPPTATGSFFGLERVSRNVSSRETAAARSEEDQSATSATAERNNDEEDVESSDATAAAHLREAAIVQMAELGLPRQWAELALSRVGGTNIEAAVHFCLERGGDMERLLAEESERRPSSFLSSRRRAFASRIGSSSLIRQLVEMGFPRHWCVEALSATRNNVDDALTWILTNSDRLSAEDEAAAEEAQEEDEEDEEEDHAESEEEEEEEGNVDDEEDSAENTSQIVEDQPLADEKKPEATPKAESVGWSGVCPVRFVSGRSSIDPKTLEITGLPNGGFSSVGTKGVLLTSGKWYYEAEIKTAGCIQIGWADSSFVSHCQADRGDGCGDGPSSWAFDGWRRYRWHLTATEWGCRWAEGDIVGCLVDMDSMSVGFTLNGKGEEIGMGVAFSGEGFRPCSGVYACVSFNRREKLRLILGGEGTEPFKYPPPDGYRGIGEAILDAVEERNILLAEEKVLDEPQGSTDEVTSRALNKKYICDFSDGEHGHELFAWQHRYYGSDASVHLGAGRPGLLGGTSGNLKTTKSASPPKNENPTVADISSRLSKILSKASKPKTPEVESEESFVSSINSLRDAYHKIDDEVNDELKEVCACLCVLYSQKLVMHTLVAESKQFNLRSFLPLTAATPWSAAEDAEEEVSRRLWRVIEHCTSLQSSGWVGEAGAMAVAAEALGLGISAGAAGASNSIPKGMCSVGANNDRVLVLCGGVTQFLSSAISPVIAGDSAATSTALTFAACSEYAIGSDVGGSLSFIRSSLQSAVASSTSFRQVLLAAVRRAIRLLAVTEYSSDEGASEDDDALDRKRPGSGDPSGSSPDARLVSFLTGVLLSEPVSERLVSENVAVRSSLFEAWCIGLLSASSPWRMVCAFTAAGILNKCPEALSNAISRVPIVARYLGRLESTVLRRTWAERAAVPVISKYCQAMIELLASVKRALRVCPGTSLPSCIKVDSATPLPFTSCCSNHEKPEAETSECKSWECSEGWVVSNTGWEIWTGTVEIMDVEWKTPPRSIVRTLMDGGEGPPLLRENCTVMRGVDWDAGNDDGKDLYEKDKAEKEEQRRATEEEERKAQEQENEEQKELETAKAETDPVDPANEVDPADSSLPVVTEPPPAKPEPKENEKKSAKSKKKKKKVVPSKLPLGTVLSIEPWDGVPAMARKVKWHLTGKEGVYHYGGGGGKFDLIHVETNDKETRVRKKHPPPESLEQTASRYGFGRQRVANVILRLRNCPLRNGSTDSDTDYVSCDGILEWPDFGAGILVACKFYSDGAVAITEKSILYGSKDSGWEARFGQPAFVPGREFFMSPTHSSSCVDGEFSTHDELLGDDGGFVVQNLRNKEDGGRLRVTSEMRLLRSKQNAADLTPSLTFSSSQPPPICFDPNFHASSISLSKDKRSVTCATSDGRGVAFGNVGFTKGVHYWEVKLEKAEIGSVYIGVAEKPGGPSGSSQGSSYGLEGQPRLNRWLGWGFVNFRATYTAGAERVYGAHCHAGDTVGVLLDCDAGRINYFIDGVKYGEHILNDLGCAFENVSPFGFNADGCGSGGAGQGAPSGIDGGRTGRYPANGAVRPKALWPVIGLRHPGDRVTMSSKWMTTHGADGAAVMRNALAVDEVLCAYERPLISLTPKASPSSRLSLPRWFVEESFHEYTRWKSGRWLRTSTRGSGPCKLSSYGLDVDLDTSLFACAAACAAIGLPVAFLPGDRVDVKRSAGRTLELQEEAVILGAYQGRLFYRLVSQKSEGGSLMEGGGRAWFWDESEAVDGGLQLIGEGLGRSIKLPKLNRFNPPNGGLKVVYGGGAVVRSDLEIFDGSKSIGTIPSGTIIPANEVIERRLNSCGVVRYLIDHEPIGLGWISSRIRGGKEEPIVEVISHEENDESSASEQPQYITPEDSAREWYSHYVGQAIASAESLSERKDFSKSFNIEGIQEFEELLLSGMISGLSVLDSDSLVAATYGRIADALPHSSEGGCPFVDCALALCASQPREKERVKGISNSIGAIVHEVANESLVHVVDQLPSTKALMARISMLRAFNRRARFGLPWLPLSSAQEGSAILGGLSGFGPSLERAGRTWDSTSKSSWVQAPSISSRLRDCRGILFNSTKRSYLDSVLESTTTPTPLSHDEYELPREVRTVRVNRLKARRAMISDDSTMKKKHCVFSQLQREMRGWSGATLRRGFVAKGHGGQRRAFKVKLVGEGVNDYSGPYREVFTDAMQEVTDLDPSGNSSLGFLQPSANNQTGVGEGRDLFVFAQSPDDPSAANEAENNSEQYSLSNEERELLSSFSSMTHKKNESSREIAEALTYLGKLVGTACRHGIPVDLPLPLGMVFKRLTEEKIDVANILKEIDLLAYRSLHDEDGTSVCSPSGQILATQRRLLNSFAEGLSSVLPVELLSMFTGEQLRDIICGNPYIDVELLRRVVEYEGYNEDDQVVTFFWEVLREMTTSERKLFLQFVWARNRLPLKESDFDAPFKIQKDTKSVDEDGDYPLPSASTCFFSLSLPEYPEKQVLKQKLLFAIENVTTMESDYVTNDVEVSEGWRGL